jgi:hypothetical protein
MGGNVYVKKWRASATHSHTRNSVKVTVATTALPERPVIP